MGDDFHTGAELDQYANCGTTVPKVCNLTNHEKSERHQ